MPAWTRKCPHRPIPIEHVRCAAKGEIALPVEEQNAEASGVICGRRGLSLRDDGSCSDRHVAQSCWPWAALKPPGIVAATVAGEPIDVAEVNRLVKISLRGRPVSKAALAGLEAQALEQIINRRLVMKHLEDKNIKITDEALDDAIRERQKAAQSQNGDLADDLGRSGLTLKAYRDEVEWEMRWGKYLQSQITDEVLQKFFEARHQEFDGTELRLSQILLRPNGRLDPEQLDALMARAQTIRDEVLGELTTFADAARKYSSAPSRKKGGDIGFIPRHGVMPEDFTDAAFALEKGQISNPIVTHLGVHLIECTDIRPGKKTWRDVRASCGRP